jgi:hypothetical protein
MMVIGGDTLRELGMLATLPFPAEVLLIWEQ